MFFNTPYNGWYGKRWQFIYGNKVHYSVFEKMGRSIDIETLSAILLSAALFLFLLYKLLETLIEKK